MKDLSHKPSIFFPHSVFFPVLFWTFIFFCSACKCRQIGGGAWCLQTCLERLQESRVGSWWAQTHFQVLWRVVWSWFDTYWFPGHDVDSWPPRRYCFHCNLITHLAGYILMFYSKYTELHTPPNLFSSVKNGALGAVKCTYCNTTVNMQTGKGTPNPAVSDLIFMTWILCVSFQLTSKVSWL